MFKNNNAKYRYLVDSINMIRSKNLEIYYNYGLKFSEYNVISIGGVRQSGKSLSMKVNFKSDKDIYISPRMLISKDFMEDAIEITTGSILHKWTKEDKKNFKERDCVLSVKSENLEERILKILKEDSIIYLDVFSIEILSNHEHVVRIIDFLEKLKKENKFNVCNIILVHT